MLKLEASILPKPSHDSRERCSAAFQTVFCLGLLALRKAAQEKIARRRTIGTQDCAAKYCAREGCIAKDYAEGASRRKAM